MSQISQLYTQSLLAFAAYANLSKGIPKKEYLKFVGMTENQATDFASNWTVVTQYTDASGVSATVFEENATGKRYLAIRGTESGTESPGDINADYILAMGFPSYLNPQFVQLRSQVSQWLSNGTLTSGFSVSGHSLGGYLAAAIGTWFSGQSNGIYTYNAPGLGGLVGNALDAFRAAFGLSNTALVDGITNVRGTAGISLIAGIGTQLAPPLYIETESNINPIANHSIVGLTDALAVANIFSKLDASLTPEKFNNMFLGASSSASTSLEGMLDTLRKLFGKANATPYSNRIQFYTNYYDLQNGFYFQALQGNIKIDLSTASLGTLARNQFSALISLVSLSPIVLSGTSQESQGMLDTKLRMAWGEDVYGKWLADQSLTAEQRAAGEANFSDAYLQDRAAMLTWIMQSNTLDMNPPPSSFSDGLAWGFYDWTSGKQIVLRQDILQSKHNVIFGRERADFIAGEEYTDRLYGASGNDSMFGFGGDDILKGGDGADTLYAGSDQDVLEGGKGNDVLCGGKGYDTYVYNIGDGVDTIVDEDNLGRILIKRNGQTIQTGTLYSWGTNIWTDASGKVPHNSPWRLVLEDGGVIELGENFQDGDFGLYLAELLASSVTNCDQNPLPGSYSDAWKFSCWATGRSVAIRQNPIQSKHSVISERLVA